MFITSYRATPTNNVVLRFVPALGRMVLWNMVFFQLYERFKKRGGESDCA